MGTRADFYVGKGTDSEWIGSIAWDGYLDGIDEAVLESKTEPEYRESVAKFFSTRDDVTLPENGWPWPWEDSHTTDCAYTFFSGEVFHELDGLWVPVSLRIDDGDEDRKLSERGFDECVFPDMSSRQNVRLSGNRYGLIVISR